MKKLSFISIFAIMVAAFVVLPSCKDDDEKDNGGDPTEENSDDPAPDTFWDVLAQIVQADQITSDYEGKTFEPTIGVEDSSDPQTRIVYVNNMEAAAKSFYYLTGADVNESTASYEWKDEKVGTMTYTKVNDGKDYATVDVNIASVPHLSKIVYRDGEQSGANGKFEGSAYYRFGDVVSRTRADDVKEYWICVRPAFGIETKETTHWISVSPLSDDNLFAYPGSNGFDYTLPKNLKYDKEHFQNLAEMLFAMCFPDAWQDNIINYSPKIFHDFKSANLKYHNSSFWYNVAAGWEAKGISQKVFGKELAYFAENLQSQGLYLLYSTYSWSTTFSNYCTLYQMHYTNTKGTKYCNMQTDSPSSSIKKQMIDKKNHSNDIKLSIKEQQKVYPYITCKEFFGDDNPRWVVRYATGAELSDVKKYTNVFEPISGVTDEYRYYRDVNPVTALSTHAPEITSDAKSEPALGKIIGSNGRFYNSIQDAKKETEPIAIVVHYGEAGSVESNTNYKGLAMAINPITDVQWAASSNTNCDVTKVDINNIKTLNTVLDGIASTNKLVICHDHSAAKACRNYNGIPENLRKANGFSEWFMPSAGQWILAFTNMKLKWSNDGTFDNIDLNDLSGSNVAIASFLKFNPFLINTIYYTSTMASGTEAYYLGIDGLSDVKLQKGNKTKVGKVYPMIAF